MRHRIILMTALAVLLLTVPVVAQQSPGYDLSWNVISSGGGTSQSDNYTLSGSLGQFGVGETSGASYTLSGGFWAGVSGISIQAVTGMTMEVDTDGVVVVNKVIEETRDPATGLPELVQGGIGGYQDQLTYNGTLINIVEVRPGDAPFDAITSTVIDDIAGVTTFNHTQGASTPQAPIRVAKAAIRLTGCTTDVATLNDSFTSIQSTTGAAVSEVAPSALTFRLGDAKSDGTVNIADALFGAQYLASLRGIDTVGGDLALVNPVNMASVKDDGVAGDKINIADVLFIAQGLVGLRDACFTLLEVGTPPPGR